jgi:hypothetical protein
MDKQSNRLKVEMPFDEAMRRAVRVPPMPLKKKAKAKKRK